ncbi:g-protein coupled receptor GRL101 [Nephila pilipes]|uniref:G-protein coupled receptor GRL101 n=1 Tax=Nephila pilipes TaxID=299642 RepID=A0A8X6MJH3_NEPPI|nr:g-protein coupled receptor GRL101 [Nephila pilipes]
MMVCSKLNSAEELRPIIKSTDSMDMFALTIMESTLLYIPSDLFRNTKYQKIRFLNTQLMSLSDGDLAFEGLEDRLEELRATDAQYITQWDWSQLKNHRRLSLIDINLIAMYSIEQEFPPLKSLRTLGISKAEISSIHPTAFARLEGLWLLDLRDNLITEMTRSMLPNPAEELHILELSGNSLTSLPADMFEGMPSLKQLELNYNKLITLEEETFLWPFENLQTLMLKGNEFRCDCRLRWMKTKTVNYRHVPPLVFDFPVHDPVFRLQRLSSTGKHCSCMHLQRLGRWSHDDVQQGDVC